MAIINEDVVRSILDQHYLKFSKQTITTITRASKDPSRLLSPNISKALSIEHLRELRAIAADLSAKLREYYPHLEDDPEDIILPTLNGWMVNWGQSLDYYKKQKSQSGATAKFLAEKFYVQILIVLYERETGEIFITDESTSYGRERNYYNPKLTKYVKSFLKLVFPDVDPIELIKAARRDPMPLSWTRNMINKLTIRQSKKSNRLG